MSYTGLPDRDMVVLWSVLRPTALQRSEWAVLCGTWTDGRLVDGRRQHCVCCARIGARRVLRYYYRVISINYGVIPITAVQSVIEQILGETLSDFLVLTVVVRGQSGSVLIHSLGTCSGVPG